MISLKDYINESIFDNEETIFSKVNKSVISDIKAWAKTHITKIRGRMKSYMGDNGDYILEYTGVEDLEINFSDIPDIVKIKANNPESTHLSYVTDGFMEKFVDSEFNKLFIKSGDAKFIGDMQPCKINTLYLDLDKCIGLSDFSPFKNCNIYELTVSCCKHNKRSIDFDGLNIKNELKFWGHYELTGKNAYELTVTGKYNADNIDIQNLKIHGLPQKISGVLSDNDGLSWWDNDIKSIGGTLMFGIPNSLFKEIYGAITSKNFKLPKLNKAVFYTNGRSYKFNNSKDMLIALQAGYMRKVIGTRGEMSPRFNSYELEFKTKKDSEHIIKQWLDETGYKLITDYDLKPISFDEYRNSYEYHTQQNKIVHVFDKKDKIIATYCISSSARTAPYVISTDENIIDEIKNMQKD